MAKICGPFGTSPNVPFLHDWADEMYTHENAIFKPDPTELFEELNFDWPTIHSDIQKIESDGGIGTTASVLFSSGFDGYGDMEVKAEIRNGDCMWSGVTHTTHSTSASSSLNDGVTTAAAFPLAAVTGNTQNIHNNKQNRGAPPTVVVANNSKPQSIKREVKLEYDFEQQLQLHSIPNCKTINQQQQKQQTQLQQSMQHIPPGTSLLRKSNPVQKKLQMQQKCGVSSTIQIPKMYTSEFLRERDQLLATIANDESLLSIRKAAHDTNGTAAKASPIYVRPDTPHSLDDDCTAEFKHNVDLRACVMGSNNISLKVDPTNFINHVSQELQDTSKSQIDTRLVSGSNSLSEVLDVIVKDNGGHSTTSSLLSQFSNLNCASDSEFDEETSCSDSRSSMMDGDLLYDSSSTGHGSYAHMHSDHSYTRCKEGVDDLAPNLETPSDSDEEIDVVSIGDKKLPTYPSDKDRRVIQKRVAIKFYNRRIVKTANGIRTIPPRRRVAYVLPYTPASSSPVKSVANSSYPSPTSTPHQNQHMMETMTLGTTPIYVTSLQQHNGIFDAGSRNAYNNKPKNKSRKGLVAVVDGVEYTLPPSKKSRARKNTKANGAASNRSSKKRQSSADDTTPGRLAKRSLHNIMERQRRIRLRNLFDLLKNQIPILREKERAAKVVILREAEKLYETQAREDRQLCEQKAHLREQLRRKQALLARLRTRLV